ncbi:MAG: protein kinase domain-containing protein [Pirellula sp.]
MSDKEPNLDSLFEDAVEMKSAAERAAYLDQACGDDLELRRQVELLLQSDEQAGSFLNQPPVELEATILTSAASGNLAAALEAGLAPAFTAEQAVLLGDGNHSVLKIFEQTLAHVPRVALRDSGELGPEPITRSKSPEMPKGNSDSRYQLQGEIARGGMGAILRGRDTDLGRDLAIKVLLDQHKNKPEVVQRFIEEAQIGGQLQHPGIAPIYELGQFADKRPFFAMKLVKGETLSKLLADREEAAAERGKFIGIFEQICQTMAYAHSRGVIHRDLKPANIMVGAFGEVQVMDWGLAKVLPVGGVADERKACDKQKDQSIIQTLRSQPGSDVVGTFGTLGSQTQMGSVMGTPAYMPPEQALGEIDHLDERADVFGLGAILCEILTGKPPYVADDGTHVFRMASRGKLEDCFQRLDACGADAELIALTKHCLELEPQNRPRDASVLAERVSGYLESVETKLRETERARFDAQVRAEELRRRQKLAYSAGAAIAASLLIGIAVSGWQAVRAMQAEKNAQAETRRAIQAEKMANEEALRAGAAEKNARDEAVRATRAEELASLRLTESETARQESEAARADAEAISKFLTNMFESARPGDQRGGREVKVVDILETAAKNLQGQLADQPDRRAKLLLTLGSTYFALGLRSEAIPLLEEVRAHYQRRYGPDYPGLIHLNMLLGFSYGMDGRKEEQLKALQERLDISLKVNGAAHSESLYSLCHLADAYDHVDKEKAVALRRQRLQRTEEVVAQRRKDLGPENLETIRALAWLAESYSDLGRADDALKVGEEVLALRHKAYPPGHFETLLAMRDLAGSYFKFGRKAEALALREELVTLSATFRGLEKGDTLAAMTQLAASYLDAGRTEEGLGLVKQVLETRVRIYGPKHSDTRYTVWQLANAYRQAGRPDDAANLPAVVEALSRTVQPTVKAGTATPKADLSALREVARDRVHADRFQAVLLGDVQPTDNAERLTLALHAFDSRKFTLANRLWTEVVESETVLNDDLRSQLRYGAARAAILAAAATGEVEPVLDATAKGKLQKQVMDWLLAELAANHAGEPKVVEMAAELANLLLTKTTHWSVLKPTEMKSENGATLTLQQDGSILASGINASGDAYTVRGVTGVAHIAAVRLEALPDPSLPNKGPGRHSSGNFQLSALRLFSPATDSANDMTRLSLASAFASFDYKAADADVAGLVDEKLNQVWQVWGRFGEAHQAIFLTRGTVAAGPGQTIVVELRHKDDHDGINLGRFRLSVSDDPADFNRERLRFAALKVRDPWAKLAATYMIIGDQPALDVLLTAHPAAAASIGDLHATDKNWERAIAEYSKLITPETSDAALLSKRAAAYIATEQWDLAKADWLAAIELQPNLLVQAFGSFGTAEQWELAAEFGKQMLQQQPDLTSVQWMSVPPVLVLAGDRQAYAEVCERMRQRFADSTFRFDEERTVKVCLLWPNVIDAHTLSARRFSDSLDNGTAGPLNRPWFWATRALLAYRQGDADLAVRHIAKSEEDNRYLFAHAMNLAVLALAQHELGRTDEARTALAEAAQLIGQQKEDPNIKGNHDLLIAEILFREAAATIGGNANSSDDTSK